MGFSKSLNYVATIQFLLNQTEMKKEAIIKAASFFKTSLANLPKSQIKIQLFFSLLNRLIAWIEDKDIAIELGSVLTTIDKNRNKYDSTHQQNVDLLVCSMIQTKAAQLHDLPGKHILYDLIDSIFKHMVIYKASDNSKFDELIEHFLDLIVLLAKDNPEKFKIDCLRFWNFQSLADSKSKQKKYRVILIAKIFKGMKTNPNIKMLPEMHLLLINHYEQDYKEKFVATN